MVLEGPEYSCCCVPGWSWGLSRNGSCRQRLRSQHHTAPRVHVTCRVADWLDMTRFNVSRQTCELKCGAALGVKDWRVERSRPDCWTLSKTCWREKHEKIGRILKDGLRRSSHFSSTIPKIKAFLAGTNVRMLGCGALCRTLRLGFSCVRNSQPRTHDHRNSKTPVSKIAEHFRFALEESCERWDPWWAKIKDFYFRDWSWSLAFSDPDMAGLNSICGSSSLQY